MKHWKDVIKGRGTEISTSKPLFGAHWEMRLKGRDIDQALELKQIPDAVINLWDAEDDPEGSEAEKIHHVAVKLFGRRPMMTVKSIYDRVLTLAHQMAQEEKKIEQMEKEALR